MHQDHRFRGLSRRRLLGATALGCTAVAGLGTTARAATDTESIAQPDAASPEAFVDRAFEMRALAADSGDQSYGAVIVDPSGCIVGQAPGRVVVRHDPTAHAEMEAIRDAARRLGSRDLSGYVMYSSSRPCPMCEAAAYWANLSGMINGRAARDAGRPRLCG